MDTIPHDANYRGFLRINQFKLSTALTPLSLTEINIYTVYQIRQLQSIDQVYQIRYYLAICPFATLINNVMIRRLCLNVDKTHIGARSAKYITQYNLSICYSAWPRNNIC